MCEADQDKNQAHSFESELNILGWTFPDYFSFCQHFLKAWFDQN